MSHGNGGSGGEARAEGPLQRAHEGGGAASRAHARRVGRCYFRRAPPGGVRLSLKYFSLL
jgi:hypothetical protein